MSGEGAQPIAIIAAQIAERLQQMRTDAPLQIVAIDGRCGAGKSTLADALRDRLGCAVFHMDDFFLRPEQRTEARLAEAGGNVDYARVEREILRPLRDGAPQISYQPYCCRTQTLLPPVCQSASPVVVVEGAYSCHPTLWAYYDLHIFLTTNPDTQLRRLQARNGDGARMFVERWIPLEERYFAAFSLPERCELRFAT